MRQMKQRGMRAKEADTHTHIHTHSHTFTHIHTHTHNHTHSHTDTLTHTRIHTCTHRKSFSRGARDVLFKLAGEFLGSVRANKGFNNTTTTTTTATTQQSHCQPNNHPHHCRLALAKLGRSCDYKPLCVHCPICMPTHKPCCD